MVNAIHNQFGATEILVTKLANRSTSQFTRIDVVDPAKQTKNKIELFVLNEVFSQELALYMQVISLTWEVQMFAETRVEDLVATISRRGINDSKIIDAIAAVPREEFVPWSERTLAYRDIPLPIGEGQTISQPSLVALMTEYLNLNRQSRVLEVGTGCGYQTAILAELAKEVYSVEVRRDLALAARGRLRELGYENVKFKIGDGTEGWPEYAPFDAIIVTAADKELPTQLIEQLTIGGKLVIPIGPEDCQTLYVYTRTKDGYEELKTLPVRFVPIVSEDPKFS